MALPASHPCGIGGADKRKFNLHFRTANSDEPDQRTYQPVQSQLERGNRSTHWSGADHGYFWSAGQF
jgi:hypothetical protein